MKEPMRPYPVITVAKEIVKNYRDFIKANDEKKGTDGYKKITFSKEKLVMILYYVQGYAKQQNEIPMFRDPMVALSTVYLDIKSAEFQKVFQMFGYMRENLAGAIMEIDTKILSGYNPELLAPLDKRMIYDVCRGFIPYDARNIFGRLLVNEQTFQNGVARTLINYENNEPAAAINLKLLGKEFRIRSARKLASTAYLLKTERA